MCATQKAIDVADFVRSSLGAAVTDEFYNKLIDVADEAIRSESRESYKIAYLYGKEDAVHDLAHGHKTLEQLHKEVHDEMYGPYDVDDDDSEVPEVMG